MMPVKLSLLVSGRTPAISAYAPVRIIAIRCGDVAWNSGVSRPDGGV